MLRYVFFVLLAFLPGIFVASAAEHALLVAELESGKTVVVEGDIQAAYSPCSTFKIPLALMGFDSGIFLSPTEPSWPYKNAYADLRPAVHKTINPKSWLAESAVWYSQVLTRKMGESAFKAYVDRFDYGNRDISGDPGKNNGLTASWLSSSLKISVGEQVLFLRKMLCCKLPVSENAVAMTKAAMPVFFAPGGWTIYGKTGSRRDHQAGWFVGWGARNGQTLVFAYLQKDSSGPEAREALLGAWPGYAGSAE